MNQEQILTRQDVCKIFGVTARTIIRWEKAGIITPAYYIRTRPKYTLESIRKVPQLKQTRVFTAKSKG